MPLVLPVSGVTPLPGDLDFYQVEISGLRLGKNTPYKISNISGIGTPDVRVFDRPRPNEHGAYVSRRDLVNIRKLEITLMCVDAGDDGGAVTLMENLQNAWKVPQGGLVPIKVRLPGWNTRILNGRPRQSSYDIKQMIYGAITATLEYVADDPRWYDNTISNVLTGNPTFPGIGFDIAFDVSFGGLGTHYAINAQNTGDFETKPVVVIEGPVTNPSIENSEQAANMQFLLTLEDGEFLVVDFDERTVMLNGTASRYDTLSPGSHWFYLQPGDNHIRFLGGLTGDDTKATIYWRNAWL